MRIGFDAYFAFHYKTGVAHYGRNLFNALAKYYPDSELVLFTDKVTGLYQPAFPNVTVVEAGYDIDYYDWLTNPGLHKAITQNRIELFHGIDHGLPSVPNLKTIVTIHDLFFESHPGMYSEKDVAYYKHIAPLAANDADLVIAISRFTKNEITSRYNVPEDSVRVCYQSCNPLFFETVPEERKAALRKQFALPGKFWLYVGSVIERKNLLNICKAINSIRERSSMPLMVIGEGGDYLELVKQYVVQNDLSDRVRFLSYTQAAQQSASFQQARDVPAFHQMAHALLYPSYLEGFGIPLIEAFASGLPVITSGATSLPEIGGKAAMYVDPRSVDDIANALLRLEKDEELRSSMIAKGKIIVDGFTEKKSAEAVMGVYRELL